MFLNRKKLIFIFLFLFAVSLVPNVSLAVDARCWTEEECIKFRSETLGLPLDKAKEGFYDKDDAVDICGKDTETDKNMGFCLPSSATKTSITFGGKNDFLHMGDFIQYMYRYGTWIIAVLAVVMIIVAGVQWVLSAGSADKIKEAQKRISGAVLGLILALLSYMILNLLN
ncbi:hypothetical protein HOF40_00135, partial [Candidatus Parcubacteria bacterium]|nr:hypothetical protein [Candidatus Parcubacteria bacterium]